VPSSADPVVVVGASLAGLRAAEALRREGYDGPLVVVGDEPHPPYDRPPLSKQVLIGKIGPEATALAVSADLDVEWRFGTRVEALDLDGRRLSLAGGDELPFDGLVIATGSAPRRLPSVLDPFGAPVLRTLDDAVALRAAFAEGAGRVVVVGAGVIGLEVASSARTCGLEVTVVEAARTPLARVVGPLLGEVVAELHRAHGVDLRLGVGVEVVVGGARPEGVRLTDGTTLHADLVVLGIGAAPVTGWLEGSGVDLADGVRCDDRLRVLAGGRPLPRVVAAGDVARWDGPDGVPIRVEHWTNAVESAEAAAAALLRGDDAPAYAPVPYVWSDQHDRKIQVVGVPSLDDDLMIVDGSAAERKFAAAFGRDGRLAAGVAFGKPAKAMAIRRLLEAGSAFPPEM
jgi:NADPH-dependent 2,4-dienoyl-CoA reductase/sulfur reductase-like enzyme